MAGLIVAGWDEKLGGQALPDRKTTHRHVRTSSFLSLCMWCVHDSFAVSDAAFHALACLRV